MMRRDCRDAAIRTHRGEYDPRSTALPSLYGPAMTRRRGVAITSRIGSSHLQGMRAGCYGKCVAAGTWLKSAVVQAALKCAPPLVGGKTKGRAGTIRYCRRFAFNGR